ncbi:EF-P beta-lysylation protein EpmB [Marinomonas sp. PE14-40]|uniref:EF-P beta-lysylation protein EpmB n=1 Tax=Marinomonas sp. PE14-40 TaxID=3060621 RepID=UPI003F67BAFB
MLNPAKQVNRSQDNINLTALDDTPDWLLEIKAAIKSFDALANALELDVNTITKGQQAHQSFPLMVPAPYLSRIKKANLQDPLLLQILPLEQEMHQLPGYVKDPLAEKEHNPQKALVHKYSSRILVITSGSCAINCRYCFRRHFPYADNHLSSNEWSSLLDYLKLHPEINEVILSGGDPLMIKDKPLASRIKALESLPQIKRIRIHTRLPVVIPSRINDELLNWVNETRLKVVMVWHINHANEIDHAVSQAAEKLVKAGVKLFNQGVILKGINDTSDAQVALSEALFDADILPYYMFTLDPVEGAAHFDISLQQAQVLMGEVAARLPGYLVPKLAKEIPGKSAKTLFAPIL